MKLPLAGGIQNVGYSSFTGIANAHSGASTINLMVEPPYHEGDSGSLVSFPGIEQAGSAIGAVAITAMAWPGSGDLLYAIAGRRLYSFNIKTYAWTDLTGVDLPSTSFPGGPGFIEFLGVSAAGVPNYIIFGSSQATTSAYYYDVAGMATVALSTLGILGSGSTSATFLDGRVIIQDKGNVGRFYYSDVLSPVGWSALNFASAESQIDALRAVIADKRELYLFGSKSTEVWFSTGDANAPYRRFQGGTINMGLVGPMTAQRFNGSVAWLSRNEAGELRVCLFAGNYVPKVISTPGIDALLSAAEQPEQCFAYVFQFSGHEMYCLTVPTFKASGYPYASITLCFDALTEQWSQWTTDGSHQAPALCCAHAGNMSYSTAQAGRVFVGNGSGKIGYLSRTTTKAFGASMPMSRTMPRIKTGLRLARCASVMLEVGYINGSGSVASGVALSVAAPIGSTSFTLVSDAAAAGFTVGKQFYVFCDNGFEFMDIITAVVGNTFSFDTPTPASVAAGKTPLGFEPTTVTLTTSRDVGQNTMIHAALPVRLFNFFQKTTEKLAWRKLGASRDWLFALRVTGDAPVELRDAEADFLMPSEGAQQ